MGINNGINIDVKKSMQYNISTENRTFWRRRYVGSELYEFKR